MRRALARRGPRGHQADPAHQERLQRHHAWDGMNKHRNFADEFDEIVDDPALARSRRLAKDVCDELHRRHKAGIPISSRDLEMLAAAYMNVERGEEFFKNL